MSLKHAILGFLNYQPFSGYDLKKMFDISVRHFWPAAQSQIYRALGQMNDKGWVEQEIVEQQDHPDRKVYHITDSGRQELAHWLSTPLPAQKTRHASLIQVFFAGQLDDEAIIAMLEREADHMRSLLQNYAQVPAQCLPYEEMVNSPREAFFWKLTLEMGNRMAQAQLAWLEDVIQRLQNGEHPAT